MVVGSNTQGQRSVINVGYYTVLHKIKKIKKTVQSQYQQTAIHTDKIVWLKTSNFSSK